MEQHTSRLVQLIFSELHEQGRSQRWLARQLRAALGEGSGIWEPRLSEWKSGTKPMPHEVIVEACRLLGISETVLSFFAPVLLESSEALSKSTELPV